MKKFLSVALLALLLTACWPFDSGNKAAGDPKKVVHDAITGLENTASAHATITLDGTATGFDSGKFFVSVNTDYMKVHADQTAVTQTSAKIDSSSDLHVEFQMNPSAANAPTLDDSKPAQAMQGSADLSLISLKGTSYVKFSKLTLSDMQYQAMIDSTIKPYLNQWIAFPASKDTGASSFSPTDLLKQKLPVPDESTMTAKQLKQINDLTEQTDFLNVTSEGTPGTIGDQNVTTFKVTINQKGLNDYLDQVGVIMKEPVTADAHAKINGLLGAMKLEGTIAIGQSDGLPYHITAHGTLDSTKLPRDMQAENLGNSGTLTLKADTTFSDFGKSFSITEPAKYEQFETIMKKMLGGGPAPQ